MCIPNCFRACGGLSAWLYVNWQWRSTTGGFQMYLNLCKWVDKYTRWFYLIEKILEKYHVCVNICSQYLHYVGSNANEYKLVCLSCYLRFLNFWSTNDHLWREFSGCFTCNHSRLTILNLRKEKIGFQFWFNQLRLTASEWLLMPINVE